MMDAKKPTTSRPTHEPGYAPVLIHDDLKGTLKRFRDGLPNKDLFQERRLVTAALRLMLQHTDLHEVWLEEALRVVTQDNEMARGSLATSSTAVV